MFCTNCGAQVNEGDAFCPACGSPLKAPVPPTQPGYQQPPQYQQPQYQPCQPVHNGTICSPKERMIALLLCIFLGGMGVHRFYVGKIGTGIIWLLTFGCFGIGVLVDIITIATGSFCDSDDLPLKP